jgi:Patatin-like phospholipase
MPMLGSLRQSRPRRPLPSLAQEYRAEPVPVRIGVAFSGGGIRSAAFSLGALQALQETDIFPHVEYLAAVSGGNYIASAYTISAAWSDAPPNGVGSQQPWARGSPEEQYLRHHTDYLAPGLTGRLWLAANLLYGFIANYLPFLLSAFVLGRIVGWVLRWAVGPPIGKSIWTAPTSDIRQVTRVLLICSAALIVFSLAAVLWRRIADGRSGDAHRPRPPTNSVDHLLNFERRAGTALGFGVATVLIFSLGPGIVVLYRRATTWVLESVFGASSTAFGESWWARTTMATCWLLVALVMAAMAIGLSRQHRLRGVMLTFAAIGGSGMLVIPFLSSFEWATARGIHKLQDLMSAFVALILVILMAVFFHNRRYSMHLFYRERLSKIFAVARFRGMVGAVPVNYLHKVRFSKVRENLRNQSHDRANGDGSSAEFPHVPKLVICCAVNVSAHDAPIGRNAGSFTFEVDQSGSPLLGYASTESFEDDGPIRGTDLTLPSLMAISGAALSPMMGRLTHPAIRFLMALTNIRLGVWIPGKNLKRETGTDDPTPDAEKESGQPATTKPSVLRKTLNTIVAGWYEPGALYVLREALGTTGRRHPLRKEREFVYVSDGGHFENLGLVELIRRRCTHILCFDASLDSAGEAFDIGRAISLARADLQAEITLDPSPTMRNSDGLSESMVASGTVTYPGGAQANIILTRAVLTPTTSWDLRSFEKRDGRFPRHSTRQQSFTDEQFQAYRSLGHEGGLAAIKTLNLPPVILNAANPKG